MLTNPTKGTVSVETNGAVTMATYTCLNNYTIAGDATRICQDNDTWSGREPSCSKSYKYKLKQHTNYKFIPSDSLYFHLKKINYICCNDIV